MRQQVPAARHLGHIVAGVTGSLCFAILLAIAVHAQDGDSGAGGMRARQKHADPNAKVREKLRERIAVDFEKLPLQDVLAFHAENLDVQIHPKWHRIHNHAGVPSDTPVSLHLKNVPAYLALELMLDSISIDGNSDPQLAYFLRDGVIIISDASDVAAGDIHTIRLPGQHLGTHGMPGTAMSMMHGGADVGMAMGSGGGPGMAPGLSAGVPGGIVGGMPGGVPGGGMPGMGSSGMMGMGGAGGGMAGMPGMPGMGGMAGYGTAGSADSQLSTFLQNSVQPETWQNNGGAGTMSIIHGMLVVRNSERAIREIEFLLGQLQGGHREQQTQQSQQSQNEAAEHDAHDP